MTTTLFLIHGMWAKGERWGPFAQFLRDQGYRVVTPTLRHHDVAPEDPPPAELGSTSLLDYASDLEAEIKKLKEPPVLIGHSMGGFLAQKLAARGLARAAIFLCPAPPAGWPAILELLMPSVTRTLFATLLTKGLTGRAHRLGLKKTAYSCLNMMAPDAQKEEYRHWVHESGRALFEFAFWFLDRRRATRIDPSDITCPTLTIAGSMDRITPAPVVRRIGARYAGRGGNYREYPNQAHWILGEPGWQKVAADCAAWVEMVAGPPVKSASATPTRKPAAKKPTANKRLGTGAKGKGR